MAEPIFKKPIEKPKEKVYNLTEKQISEILEIRDRRIELDPGMGGVNPKKIREWLDDGAKITSIDFMLTKSCNFNCDYCYAEAGASKEKLSFDKISKTIEESVDLGVKMFVLTGGEPLLYRDEDTKFFDVVEKIKKIYSNKQVQISIFSDVALITKGIAERLYSNNIALCLKRDSMDADIQDKLIGVKGGMKQIEKGYEHLFNVGYGKENSPPVTVNTVFNTETMYGLIKLHRWVRQNGMEHSIVPVHYCGRAEDEDQKEGINAIHVREMYKILAEIDAKEFNDPWEVFSPFPKNKTCNRNISGVHIRSNGSVTACSESPDIDDYVFGNINEQTITEIANSEKMKAYREQFPKGKGEYICNPDVCDLNKNDLCRGGCATRSAYSRVDPNTGLIVRNSDLKMYSYRREDPLCPGWIVLAEMQGAIKQDIVEKIREDILKNSK